MPYAPGVQDISGQLRAQGIAQAGQAWSQAIGNIGNAVTDAMQTYKQNQYLTNQALGDFTAATQADQSLLRFLESGGQQQDPNQPKIPVSPTILKAYANVKNGDKVSVNDAALLGALGRTWIKTKNEALQQQHLQTQMNVANAQIADINAQAALRTADAARKQRILDNLSGLLGTQPSAGAIAAAQFAPSVSEKPSEQPPKPAAEAPSDVIQPKTLGELPLDDLNKQASKAVPRYETLDRHPMYAPSSRQPTMRDALADFVTDPKTAPLVLGAVAEKPEILIQHLKDKTEQWAKTESPVGYVRIGEALDKDGNPVEDYRLVVKTNKGDIKQSEQPLHVYKGYPPPGLVLDSTTFMPSEEAKARASLASNAGVQLQNQMRPPLTAKAKTEVESIANDIANIKMGLSTISQMEDLNEQMKQRRIGALSKVTGKMEGLIGAFDNSGEQFNSLGSNLTAQTIQGVRNIRNLQEFKALTGSVPTSDQYPESRDRNLANYRNKLEYALERNMKALELIQNGAEPDTAFVNANISTMPKEIKASAPGIGEDKARPVKKSKAEKPKEQDSSAEQQKPSNRPKTAQEIYDEAMANIKKSRG